ncbi:hypothetical protein NDU88_008156 [Pleurodeles waltl]|uniref:Uncharacterized protein n=1 Tax=Pleurodeles waltl TaxID=8319 RepID=A0AAV7NDE5_PLEWA|nr:hypothetical protein NDU88_008156 [Pleurodeles waltl]
MASNKVRYNTAEKLPNGREETRVEQILHKKQKGGRPIGKDAAVRDLDPSPRLTASSKVQYNSTAEQTNGTEADKHSTVAPWGRYKNIQKGCSAISVGCSKRPNVCLKPKLTKYHRNNRSPAPPNDVALCAAGRAVQSHLFTQSGTDVKNIAQEMYRVEGVFIRAARSNARLHQRSEALRCGPSAGRVRDKQSANAAPRRGCESTRPMTQQAAGSLILQSYKSKLEPGLKRESNKPH